MFFYLNWNDIPEPADSADFLRRYSLVSVKENSVPAETDRNKEVSPCHTFIEADNYPALRLMEKEYSGKISFIYIDPPYNTGKTSFIYNDSLNTGSAQDRHSAWLSFMKRRLTAAQKLMSEDGCIFIAIGQESLYVLKLLCDQIFGEENFINNFMWLCGKGKKDRFSRTMQQSNLCYAKNIKKLHSFRDFETASWADSNTDGDSRGNWFSGSISFDENRSNQNHRNFFEITSPSGIKWRRQWLVSEQEMEVLIRQNKIYWGTPPEYKNVPRRKIFNGERTQIIPRNIIDGEQSTRTAQRHLDRLLGEKNSFDNPKAVGLVKHLLEITDMPRNITVLDFFAGSGTTFEAVAELNRTDGGKRKCILIQKPEEISSGSRFSNIAELCFERVKKVLPETDGAEYLRLEETGADEKNST